MEARDIVIVGGGPAGMAAAIEARRSALSVTLIEERSTLGGQIYKQPPADFRIHEPKRMGKEYLASQPLIRDALASGAEILTGHVAWAVWGHRAKTVSVYGPDGTARDLQTENLILAPGAYDRPVPFPGWTLPGVVTAGGAQALVKIQKVVPGQRILMAGSGPLAIAFAVQLHQLGANLIAVLEAAPAPRLTAAVRLIRAAVRGNLGLLREGAGYLAYLQRHRIPVLYGHAIARAEGSDQVERAVIQRVDRDWSPVAGAERNLNVDTICVGYGFFPSIEIARSIGCQLRYDEQLGGFIPVRDERLETTVPGVFACGDGAGVAGSAVAIEEGRIAGIAAAGRAGALSVEEATARLAAPRSKLATLRRFRSALDQTYRVGPGIYEWATDDTIVCRCEEITVGEIRKHQAGSDPNVVKSLTRATMGLCQGRNCSRQVSWLVSQATGSPLSDLPPLSPRPPAKPVPLGAIANVDARPVYGAQVLEE